MRVQRFSIRESLTFGWSAFKGSLWWLVAVFALAKVMQYLPVLVVQRLDLFFNIDISGLVNAIMAVAGFLASQILVVKVSLQILDKRQVNLAEALRSLALFFNLGVGYGLYCLVVVFGLIFLIVPGVLWAIEFQFFPYFILDARSGPIEALTRSSEITSGEKWHLLRYNIITLLLQAAGLIALIVGYIPAYLVQLLATAHVYRQLTSHVQEVGDRDAQPADQTTS